MLNFLVSFKLVSGLNSCPWGTLIEVSSRGFCAPSQLQDTTDVGNHISVVCLINFLFLEGGGGLSNTFFWPKSLTLKLLFCFFFIITKRTKSEKCKSKKSVLLSIGSNFLLSLFYCSSKFVLKLLLMSKKIFGVDGRARPVFILNQIAFFPRRVKNKLNLDHVMRTQKSTPDNHVEKVLILR